MLPSGQAWKLGSWRRRERERGGGREREEEEEAWLRWPRQWSRCCRAMDGSAAQVRHPSLHFPRASRSVAPAPSFPRTRSLRPPPLPALLLLFSPPSRSLVRSLAHSRPPSHTASHPLPLPLLPFALSFAHPTSHPSSSPSQSPPFASPPTHPTSLPLPLPLSHPTHPSLFLSPPLSPLSYPAPPPPQSPLFNGPSGSRPQLTLPTSPPLSPSTLEHLPTNLRPTHRGTLKSKLALPTALAAARLGRKNGIICKPLVWSSDCS